MATQSSVDGWPLWASLTGNRCVSSEDEGPTDKHYWRTSATCHNTGRSGAPPCIHQLQQRACVRGSNLRWQAHSPITHPRILDGSREHVWSRHLPVSAGPQPPSDDRRENAPVHLKNNSGIAPPPTEEQAHTHTLHHQCTLLRCLPHTHPHDLNTSPFSG